MNQSDKIFAVKYDKQKFSVTVLEYLFCLYEFAWILESYLSLSKNMNLNSLIKYFKYRNKQIVYLTFVEQSLNKITLSQ